MTDTYQCCDPRRRTALAGTLLPVSGVDYIEVTQGATTADPTVIDIWLVKPLALPAALLTPAQIAITGGLRFPAPKVSLVEALPGPGTVDHYRVTLPGGQPTDFSTYQLALVTGPGGPPPGFIDPRLSTVDFSFKIACPSDFDCRDACDDRPDPGPPEPQFDYAARDWRGFRRQMLDRIATLVPGFRQDDAADFTVTLVEALAYRADQQSYRLDSIATEGFLDTARAPSSLARLSRLVDYHPGQGISARVPLAFAFTPGALPDGLTLPAATPVLARTPGLAPVLAPADYARALGRALTASPGIYETMAPVALWSWRNQIDFHTWSDAECRLARGATACTLIDTGGGGGPLRPGDLLLLAETRSPVTGDPADADPARRHLVRLTAVTPVVDVLAAAGVVLVTVSWSAADALPFDLILSSRLPGQSAAAPGFATAQVWGNVMIADHGASTPPPAHLGLTPAETRSLRPALDPPTPEPGMIWRPRLARADVARVAKPDWRGPPWLAASALMIPAGVLPALSLADDFATWDSRSDLLASGRFDRDFVVETGLEGRAQLRFGDGINGLSPAPGSVLVPSGRFGLGAAGLVGPDALVHLAVPLGLAGARITVTNPMPGQGGADPETAASVRLRAPEAFRVQDRAVTAADYAAAALRHPEVANALAVPRWTGAWQTILLFIDRQGGLPVDRAFAAGLMVHMEHFRLMGFDIALRPARPAPLDLALRVCAKPGTLRATVVQRVRDALRPFGPRDGSPGFFHPDRFSFGTPLYLSALVAAAMAVPGVETVTPLRFQRYGKPDQGALGLGLIRPAEAEVLECADDPSFPERGRLALVSGGGA